jgi:MFS family permease
MLFITICYILICVGVSKILGLYSFDFSILTHLPQSSIFTGLILGSWGSMFGKFICEYFINKFNYIKTICGSFIIIAVCFVIEFTGIFSLNLIKFYFLRTFQGFIAGILYSSILSNLGEFYENSSYTKHVTILTGGLSFAGSVYALLYNLISFKNIVKCMFFIPAIGAISSLYFIKNRNEKKKDIQKRKNIKYYLNVILFHKSLTIFAISFALSLVVSLLILKDFSRLIVVELSYLNIKSKYIKFLSVLPVLISCFFYFIKKNFNNLKYIFISICILGSINFFFQRIYVYILFFCLSYGFHLILIPYSSYLVLSKQTDDKEYFSFIIQALRAFFYSILLSIFFNNVYFTSLKSFSIFCLILQISSIILYFIGIFLLNKKEEK